MPKRPIALIVIAAVVALAALPANASASGEGLQNCGASFRAGVVPCSKAKRIAKEYAKTRARSLQGFSCSSRRRGERINARCALDEKLVLFSFRT
jgi:hypothetical protein